MLYIMSVDCPRLLLSGPESLCVISLPMNTYGSIKFLDMAYTSSEESPCPIRVDIPGHFRCADSKTEEYPGLSLSPEDHQLNLPYYDVHLTITKNRHVNNMRLWLEVSGEHTHYDEDLKCFCGNLPLINENIIFFVAMNIQGYYTPGMRVTCYNHQKLQSDVPPPTTATTVQTVSVEPSSNNNTVANSRTPTSKTDSTLCK